MIKLRSLGGMLYLAKVLSRLVCEILSNAFSKFSSIIPSLAPSLSDLSIVLLIACIACIVLRCSLKPYCVVWRCESMAAAMRVL